MQDRRASARDKVLLGGRAEVDARAGMNCVVRNLSENIISKGRAYLARVIWREANRLGLAFRAMITDSGGSDLDARLRASEKKKRELQRRIKQLIGEG